MSNDNSELLQNIGASAESAIQYLKEKEEEEEAKKAEEEAEKAKAEEEKAKLRPTKPWNEIKENQLLFYRANDGTFSITIVREIFDEAIILLNRLGEKSLIRKKFYENEVDLVWLDDKGEPMVTTYSRSILRPWRRPMPNFSAGKKKWRLW